MPSSSTTAGGPECTWAAAPAAAKPPVQSAIVSGFVAVAPSEVTKARLGVRYRPSAWAPSLEGH